MTNHRIVGHSNGERHDPFLPYYEWLKYGPLTPISLDLQILIPRDGAGLLWSEHEKRLFILPGHADGVCTSPAGVWHATGNGSLIHKEFTVCLLRKRVPAPPRPTDDPIVRPFIPGQGGG